MRNTPAAGGGSGSATDESSASVFVLGGNASTLAFISDFRPQNRQVTAWLVPLAWTPVGVAVGEGWQRVGIAADNIGGWVDQTFPPDDDRAFVGSMRDLEILQRIGWHAETPQSLDEDAVLNVEDVPEDVLDALAHPPEVLTQCAVCRRMCVRGDFVWNDRRLCAWDYHAMVFGKRGPWRSEPYEERHFETIPTAKYVAGGLLDELGVEAVAAFNGIAESTMRRLVNEVIAAEPNAGAYLAVRTGGGLTLLRENAVSAAADGDADSS